MLSGLLVISMAPRLSGAPFESQADVGVTLENHSSIPLSVPITRQYLSELIQKSGWKVLILSRQEWQRDKRVNWFEYREGAGAVIPTDKVIIYAGAIPSIGHLAHEAMHILQSYLNDEKTLEAYNAFVGTLNNKDRETFERLMQIYINEYNAEEVKSVQKGGFSAQTAQLILRAYGANETLSLLSGILVGMQSNEPQLPHCGIDPELMKQVDAILRRMPQGTKDSLSSYYIGLGFNADMVKTLLSSSVVRGASSPASSLVVISKDILGVKDSIISDIRARLLGGAVNLGLRNFVVPEIRVVEVGPSLGAAGISNVIILGLMIEKYLKGEITEGALAFVIAHEYAHINRGDAALHSEASEGKFKGRIAERALQQSELEADNLITKAQSKLCWLLVKP